jgi:3-hydroxyisobutyrate dehydrogenase
MKIGIIGVGELGIDISGNMLKAGHELLVFDTRTAAVEKAESLGAKGVASAAELAAQVPALLTVLPTPQIIEDVILGSGGVLEALQPGSVWIDHSTNDQALLMRIAAEAAKKDISVIEAPVTGGIPLAHSGKITVLVGAELDVFTRYEFLLHIVGEPVLHIGPVGSASIVKLLTNMLAFIHLWALGEGLMLGTAAGLNTGAVYEAIKASCGNSFVAETEGVPIMTGSYDYGFTLALAMKDMRLAMSIADENHVPLPMAGLAQQILQRGIARYGEKFWSTGIVKLLEDDMGLDLRAPGYETQSRWADYER